MSKTAMILSAVFFVVSISINIFASVLEKVLEKKKKNALNNVDIVEDKNKNEEN